MSEHTKTPWKFRLSQRGSRDVTLKRDHWELGGADNRGIGLIFGNDEANAAYIVRCVNSHEALVKALKASTNMLLLLYDITYKPESRQAIADQIKINQAVTEAP